MTCINPLAGSMYVDGAVEGEALVVLERHLGSCPACRERVGALRVERAALRAALVGEDDAAVPAFVPPASGSSILIGTGLALGVAAAASAFWQWLFAVAPSGMRWLNPFSFGALLESSLGIAGFLVVEGRTMLSNTMGLVGAAIVAALFAWGAVALARRRAGAALLMSALVIAVALPTPGHAVETRRNSNGQVVIAAGETIDDTLIAVGQTIVVDGDVNGDLFAFGQTITVRGKVSGNLVTAGETTTVEGSVGGSVLTAGRAIELASAHVAGNLYGFGRDIGIGQGSDITGNAITFGDSTDIAGKVGIDARSFGSRIRVSGNVVGDVEVHAQRVDLLSTANVGGNLTTHTGNADDVQIAEGAIIGGSIDRRGVPPGQHRSRYARPGFYIGQVVAFGCAYVAGLLLLWLFPALRPVTLSGTLDALRSAGIGLAAAVTLPVLAVIACITIIGLPIGIATFVLGALGLYLAKPVVGQIIGRLVLRKQAGEPHFAVTLLAGLAIVSVARNVPLVGWMVGFVVVVVGFGTIVQVIHAKLARTAQA